jgi:MFS transporter, ACS family, hexuronate transporter
MRGLRRGWRCPGTCVKIRNIRWYIAGLLFTSTVINYVDRQTLSIVAPVLTKELGLTPVEYSNILTAFLVAYTFMYLGSGYLVDRWGTRFSLSVFISWWSTANILHSLANSAFGLGFFRFLLGTGESGNFMAAAKAASEWYPPKERALVNGMVQAGAAVGAIIAAPLVTWITLAYGWRFSFVVTGSVGFVWLAAWLFLYYTPEKHPRITEEEFRHVRPDATTQKAQAGAKIGWKQILGYRETWGLLLSRFFSDPVWWFYLFWLPKFLVENRGFTLVEVGMLAWMPYLAADCGSILGGFASGKLIQRGWPVLRARAAIMLPFALMMPLGILVVYTTSKAGVLAVICMVTFSHMAWKTNLQTVTNDLYPTRVVGRVAGVVAFGNGVGGTLFTLFTGYIVQNFSYDAIFYVMACMHPTALLIFRWLVKGPVGDRK